MTDAPVVLGLDNTEPAAPDSTLADDAVVVRMGAAKFAVALTSVAEVGRAPALTRLPVVPAWLAGVANWRGRVLPVLDLRPMLGAEATVLDAQGRLLVLTDGNLAVGLLVDAVGGTTSLTDIAAFPPSSAPSGSKLLCGQLPREDGPVAILDIPAVLRLRDGLPRGRRSA